MEALISPMLCTTIKEHMDACAMWILMLIAGTVQLVTLNIYTLIHCSGFREMPLLI